jgi:mono/diheme cytochrome c family protein
VANCKGCHTNRDLKDGSFIGDPYGGGMTFGPDASTFDYTFIAPNLTIDPEYGILTRYDQDSFIKRMRNGRMHQYSPMPWGSFKRLSDSDLKAVYQYLLTVKPSKQEVKVTAIPPAKV